MSWQSLHLISNELSAAGAGGKYFLQGEILFTNSLLKISFKYSHVCPSPSFSLLTFQFVTHQHFAEPLTILLVHIFFQLCAFCDCVKDSTRVLILDFFWCKLLEIIQCEYKQSQNTRKYNHSFRP